MDKETPRTTSAVPDIPRSALMKLLQYIATKLIPPDAALINAPQTTVTIATPTKPGNPDVLANVTTGLTGYDRVFVYLDGQRLSNKAWVINDGPGTLFVIASNNLIKWSGESEIFPGEYREFYNIYELRVRSPDANTKYRVTEYKPLPSGIRKTAGISLLALQKLTAAPRVVISSELNTANLLSATLFIHLGRLVEAAFTAGVNIRIGASSKETGNGHWYPLATFTSALGSSVGSEAVLGACLAGQNVIGMASTTGFTAGDIIYIDNPTLANSEFARVTAVSANVSITIEDNLLFVQTGSTVYDQAEMYAALIDCTSIKRLRVVVDGSGAGQDFAAEVDTAVGA